MRSPSGSGARPTSTRRRYGPGARRPAGLRPPARGALPADLVEDYLAERGAADIPMLGGLSRANWLTRRPALRERFTAQLSWRNGPAEPLAVVYGPCPCCGGPTAALPGQPPSPCRTAPARLRRRPGSGRSQRRPAATRVRASLSGGGPVAGPGVGCPAGVVSVAARAARTARGRASIPVRCMPGRVRAITPGSRWPAAPVRRSTSDSAQVAATRPGT